MFRINIHALQIHKGLTRCEFDVFIVLSVLISSLGVMVTPAQWAISGKPGI